jgi:hypothetical protein
MIRRQAVSSPTLSNADCRPRICSPVSSSSRRRPSAVSRLAAPEVADRGLAILGELVAASQPPTRPK